MLSVRHRPPLITAINDDEVGRPYHDEHATTKTAAAGSRLESNTTSKDVLLRSHTRSHSSMAESSSASSEAVLDSSMEISHSLAQLLIAFLLSEVRLHSPFLPLPYEFILQ